MIDFLPWLERSLPLVAKALPALAPPPRGTVLVYHGILSSDEEAAEAPPADSVTAAEFERQMRFLRAKGYQVVPLREMMRVAEPGGHLPAKTVAITFDDGYRDTFSLAFPILRRYGLPATVFLATAYIGTGRPFPWLGEGGSGSDARYPMSWEEVVALHEGGVEIGSHTHTHPFLPPLSPDRIMEELQVSRDTIARRTGIRVQTLALPYSYPLSHRKWPDFRKSLVSALQENGYDCCCTMMRGHVTPQPLPLLLSRIMVGSCDDLGLFEAKVEGYYAWTRYPQNLFQQYLKHYPDHS